MGEQSLVEPISTDSSTHSPPTKCWLPAGGKEGSRHFNLGLVLPRWAAATSLAGLGRTWDKSCNAPGTERHGAGAGMPGDTSVPCPCEPRLLALPPLPPPFPSPSTIVSAQVGPGTSCCSFSSLPLFSPIPVQHSQRFQQGAVECLPVPLGPT